jgi:hypothetical protein
VPNAATWLPRWEDPTKLHAVIRRKECPMGCSPFTDTVSISRIIAKGAFSGPGKVLTDATIYNLKAMGYNTSLRDTDISTAAEAAMCLTYCDPDFMQQPKTQVQVTSDGGSVSISSLSDSTSIVA